MSKIEDVDHQTEKSLLARSQSIKAKCINRSVAGLLMLQVAATTPLSAFAAPSATPAPGTAPKPAGKLQPLAPKVAPAPEPASTQPATKPRQHAELDEMEQLMFGQARPDLPVDYRLDHLESGVFQRTTPHLPPEKRIENLRMTLIGTPKTSPGKASNSGTPQTTDGMPRTAPPSGQAPTANGKDNSNLGEFPPGTGPFPVKREFAGDNYGSDGYSDDGYGNDRFAEDNYVDSYAPQKQAQQEADPMPLPAQLLNDPEFQREMQPKQLAAYALELINRERQYHGQGPLQPDLTAEKVGMELIADLAKRNSVSHQNTRGENPDLRYTNAGGSDLMLESLVTMPAAPNQVLNKALVWNMLRNLMKQQDDRDALLSPHATNLAFTIGRTEDKQKFIACVEVVTKRGEMASIPQQVRVGDKIEVKGVITAPYKFQKISLAWEGVSEPLPDIAGESEEALPYFPPLDYTAYAKKSEHDWEKTMRLMQIGGIALALAGGVVVPPVALAAPLIAASGTAVRPKPVSDIPIKGGVKVDGASFIHKLPLSNSHKPGIYYVTVWASADEDSAPVAISRRAVIAIDSGKSKDKSKPDNKEDGKLDDTPANIHEAEESVTLPKKAAGGDNVTETENVSAVIEPANLNESSDGKRTEGKEAKNRKKSKKKQGKKNKQADDKLDDSAGYEDVTELGTDENFKL